MKILLYGISGAVIGRVADRYGFRVGDSLDAPCCGTGLLLPVPRMTTVGQLWAFYDAMMLREDEIDAVVICDAGRCEAFSTVHYCSPPGKLFTLCGDADDEVVAEELSRIIETLSGMLCAHEGI